MNCTHRFSPFLFLLLLLLPIAVLSTPAYSAHGPLLRHVEGLSRDYFYIDLNRGDSTYQQQSIVGGEHENHYLILGFTGDRFKVDIQSDDGNVGYIARDDSYVIESEIWSEEEQRMSITVKVIEQQTWIDVALSAHPFADYQLNVSRLD